MGCDDGGKGGGRNEMRKDEADRMTTKNRKEQSP